MTQNPMDSLRRRPTTERRSFPDPFYDESVLKPAEQAAERLLQEAAIQVQMARIVDLIDIRTVEKADGIQALNVLKAFPERQAVQHHPLQHIEFALADGGGAGALLASAPEEIAIASIRIVLREWVLTLCEALLDLRQAISELALSHLTTVVTATSNGQMVQPTTLAHYLTGQLGPLGRATKRLREAYERTNLSPLGAVSGMSTAVPMRRERLVQLLGFDGLIEHTFDAVASADVEQEIMAIVSACSVESTRLVTDLVQWARDDIGTITPGDEFVHHGTAQPQRRDPLVYDHLRIRLADHAAAANGLMTVLLGQSMLGGTATRFETFFRVEDELTEATQTYRLLTGVIRTLVVNRALTANRAHRGFATSSELADLLAIDCQLPRDEAYALAERIATEAMILGLSGMTMDTKLVDKLALEVVGREVGIEPETLGKCLAVKRFVERREVIGGPAPVTVRDIIERERLSRQRDQSWLSERQEAIAAAQKRLDEQVETQIGAGTATGAQ